MLIGFVCTFKNSINLFEIVDVIAIQGTIPIVPEQKNTYLLIVFDLSFIIKRFYLFFF